MKKQSSKERILVAARKLFVEYGFAGTSISQIESLAEVTRSLIFHHFKNKEQLWISVKQEIVMEAKQGNELLPGTDQPFESFLMALFECNIQFYRQNPDITRMINWQRIESNSEANIGVTLSPAMKAWLEAIKYYQKKGEIKKQYKPEFVATLLLSIISSLALDPSIFTQNQKEQKNYIQFCISVLQKGMV